MERQPYLTLITSLGFKLNKGIETNQEVMVKSLTQAQNIAYRTLVFCKNSESRTISPAPYFNFFITPVFLAIAK